MEPWQNDTIVSTPPSAMTNTPWSNDPIVEPAKSPDTSGINNVVRKQLSQPAGQNDNQALSPSNANLRSQLIKQYDTGQMKTPDEFSHSVAHSVLDNIHDYVSKVGAYESQMLPTALEEMHKDETEPFRPDNANDSLLRKGVEAIGKYVGSPLLDPVNAALTFPTAALSPAMRPLTNRLRPNASEEQKQSIDEALGGFMVNLGLAGEGALKGPKVTGQWDAAPSAQDFPNAAVAVSGKHAEVEVSQVLRNIYAEKGIPPAEVVEDAKSDPTIGQDLAAQEMPEAYSQIGKTEPVGAETALPDQGKSLSEQDVFTPENAEATLHPKPAENIYADVEAKVEGMNPEERDLRLQMLNKKTEAAIITPKEMAEREALSANRTALTPEQQELETKFGIPEQKSIQALRRLSNQLEEAQVENGGKLTDEQQDALDDYRRRVDTAMDKFMSHPERGAINLGEPKPEVERTDAENAILDKIRVGGAEETKQPVSWNDFYTHAVDKLDPIRRVVEALKNGDKASAIADTYKLMRNLAGGYGRAKTFIEGHTYDFNTLKNTGKGLKDILAPVKDDVQGFRAYAASRRAIELQGRDIESGMPIEQAKEVIAKGAKKYEPIFKELSTYQDSLLKYLKDSGVLSDEQVAAMRGANMAYVPFNRVMDTESFGEPGNGKVRNPIKRIKGSERAVIDPIESILRNTYSYLNIAEKNAAIKSYYDLMNASEHPEDFFTHTTPTIKPTKVSETEMEKFLKSEGIEDLPENTLTVFRAMRTPLAKDEVGFFDNGKWKVIKIDPELAEAFNGTPKAYHGLLFKMLETPAKMQRAGLFTLEFAIRHGLRNTLSSTVIAEEGRVPFENIYKGLFSYFKKDRYYEDWLKGGGLKGTLSPYSKDKIASLLESVTGEKPEESVMKKAWNLVKTPMDIMHAILQSYENINNLGAFKSKLKGLTVDRDNIIDSSYYSRNVAPDPSRIGKSTGMWNAVTMLFNVEIQHTAQLFDALRERPIPTLAKGFAYVTIPHMIMWAYNHNNPWYKDAPHWMKDSGLVFDVGGHHMWLPNPFLMGALFGTIPDRIMDAIAGQDPDGVGFKNMIKDLAEQATPNTLPSAVTPVLEQMSNHSFFRDEPLVPAHLMEGLPEYRYSPYTTELTKAMGRLVGKVPFIGQTSMASPIVIDNYLRAWTGSLGTYVKEGIDASLRHAGILPNPIKPTSTLADDPITRAFFKRYPSAEAESIERFRSDFKDLTEVTTSYKDLLKQQQFQEAQRLRRENPAAFYKLDQINKVINEQQKAAIGIYENPGISADEKRQLMDSTYYQMIKLAQFGNAEMDHIKESFRNR